MPLFLPDLSAGTEIEDEETWKVSEDHGVAGGVEEGASELPDFLVWGAVKSWLAVALFVQEVDLLIVSSVDFG